MTVTREEVIYAYRLILGREPESEAIIEQTMHTDNIWDLSRAFLASQEFVSKFEKGPRSLPVGRFLDAGQINVDLDCTPDQLQAMFDRIGRAWQAYGEIEPHWSVLVSDEFRQANLAENIELFYRRGEADIDVGLNFLRRAGLPTRFAKALDFGCGVGRLTLALSPHSQHVVGVDISPPHLRLANERAQSQAITNVAFEAIGSVADLDGYRDFDLVISIIVLQHNPPPVMAAIYAKLLAALAPGGVAIVQMPTFIEGQVFNAAEYLASEQPQMEMNGLPQFHIHAIIAAAGCRLVEMREDGAAGNMPALSHTFVVRKN